MRKYTRKQITDGLIKAGYLEELLEIESNTTLNEDDLNEILFLARDIRATKMAFDSCLRGCAGMLKITFGIRNKKKYRECKAKCDIQKLTKEADSYKKLANEKRNAKQDASQEDAKVKEIQAKIFAAKSELIKLGKEPDIVTKEPVKGKVVSVGEGLSLTAKGMIAAGGIYTAIKLIENKKNKCLETCLHNTDVEKSYLVKGIKSKSREKCQLNCDIEKLTQICKVYEDLLKEKKKNKLPIDDVEMKLQGFYMELSRKKVLLQNIQARQGT